MRRGRSTSNRKRASDDRPNPQEIVEGEGAPFLRGGEHPLLNKEKPRGEKFARDQKRAQLHAWKTRRYL